MTASSPHLHNNIPADASKPTVEVETTVVEVVEVTSQRISTPTGAIDITPAETSITQTTITSVVSETRYSDYDAAAGGALTTTRGSFSTFLAPLKQETFRQVVTEVEDKLRVVNQTLSMLDMQGFDAILEEMLSSITFKTAELLNADRASIFLLDDEKEELYSIVAQSQGGGMLEIRMPIDQGIAGEVATQKKVVNIPFDFYNDPRSAFAQKKDQETGYRTYTMLSMPLLTEQGDLVAVVQLINKLKPGSESHLPLDQQIDLSGFSEADERLFNEFSPSIRLILESSRSFYIATQRQRAANALIAATESLSKSSLDLDDTLRRVMDEAKKLMNADRSTLWLIDADRNDLWTKLPNLEGVLEERRISIGVGFAGRVAQTGKTLLIPFDLYTNPDSENSKKFDKDNGYRTCSLLCMPVFADGELIGVTQLVNKQKQGDFLPYDPSDWPRAPQCWHASFNRTDQDFMEVFNIQAGVALKNAKLFAKVKQQEQMQRDILRSLSNGVISTDKDGRIIAANESARELLGLTATELLEGRTVHDLIQIDKGDFSKWFGSALGAKDEKSRQQYYPDQTLQSLHSKEQRSVNLSINTIADAEDNDRVSGALVVMDDISDEKRMKSTLYRYMTQELAEQILENPESAKMGGDRKQVSVLFSDIRGYTSITESLTAEEVVEMLNDYFERMVDAVFAHRGTLDKYIGDAIMAVFGSPLPLQDHEWMAVQTAIEMRRRLIEFNTERAMKQLTPIRIGIGINSDEVISGNIGSSRRMEFTAIGDGVNLGSRLESASKIYGTDIIISETTYKPCADRVWVRELDYIRVKGKTRPVSVYELVALRSDSLPEQKQRSIDLYHKGLEHYRSRKFRQAWNEFSTIIDEIDIDDKAALLYMDRCQHWIQNPPTDDWDGSWALTEK